MPSLTIRNLPEAVDRALRDRAARHGRSAEAEVRHILERATLAERAGGLGSLLATFGREAALTEAEVDAMRSARDRPERDPPDFG